MGYETLPTDDPATDTASMATVSTSRGTSIRRPVLGVRQGQ
jgi:hypothetical protein